MTGSAIIVGVQVRLAGGLVPPVDREVWLPGTGGRAVVADAGAAAGEPVAVGPRDADPADAVAALERLVTAGGTLAAGAGIDLGDGFHSARIDGGPGDRRDALLAALASAAGDPGAPQAVLVALFGPAATRRVGASARRAIAAGNWPVLRFAAAVSDVLGPEQLEQVLDLTAPLDPFGEGLASDVAAHLTRLLAPVPQARRLTVLVSLWEQVVAHRTAAVRREQLRQSQDTHSDVEAVSARYRQGDDDGLLAMMAQYLGPEPALADVARWVPPEVYWQIRVERLWQDALAATVLGRMARTAFDHDELTALATHHDELVAVAGLLTRHERRAARGPQGALRPIVDVYDLVHSLPGRRKVAAYVAQRLRTARDWGIVLTRAIQHFFWHDRSRGGAVAQAAVEQWDEQPMTGWRAAAGTLSPDRLDDWVRSLERPGGAQVIGGDDGPGEPDRRPLPDRLRDDPDAERIGDMFWYAELGDTVARLYGHERAEVDSATYGCPRVAVNPPPDVEPLRPRADSITVAVAGAAQLAELGGTVPPRPASWTALADGLYQAAAVAEALTGAFPVPPVLDRIDGSTVPGTDLRVEVARTGRQLAEWAGYMGNCIAGDYYSEAALDGDCVLLALRGPDSRIVLNVELRPRQGHWVVDELKARYNKDPQVEHQRAVRRWAGELPAPVPAAGPPARVPHARPGRRSDPAGRIRRESGPALVALLAEPPLDALIELAHLLPAAPQTTGPEAVTALRRAAPATVTEAVRRALADGPDLTRLWAQTAARPMAQAVAALGDDRFAPLADDAPLPRNLRPLSHLDAVAAARTVDIVTRRVRAALGRLLKDDDPALVRAVLAHPVAPMLCAMSLAVTWWGRPGAVLVAPGDDEVPGFPSTVLSADPWRAARRDAADLGAEPGVDGLVVPYSWLGSGGWAALWSRAERSGQ